MQKEEKLSSWGVIGILFLFLVLFIIVVLI